jgi:hypothetical protein
MTGFLAELGRKLADQWLTLLVLPGALLVAAATIADTLGQAHALDLAVLRARITGVAATPAAHSPGTLLLAAGAILAASALAGLAAAALGSAISRAWTASGPAGTPGGNGPIARLRPASWLTALRVRSWQKRNDRWHTARNAAEPLRRSAALIDAGIDATSPAEILAAARSATRMADAALARRNRIGRTEPARPTWIGDRFRDVEERVASAYHLDIAVAWPRLWVLLPDNLRADLSAAYDSYTASARLVGWALLYVLIGAWWWPSLLIAAVTIITGWTRGRTCTAVLADLIETAVDLHGRTLAAQLGLACDGPLDRDTGYQITQRLRREPG